MCLFTTALKKAEITHKKDGILLKEHYRPAKVLTCVLKLFKCVFVDQLSCYFQN